MLLGEKKMRALFDAGAAVFGIGGVGKFLLVDNDVVSLSNINRQIIATHKSLGRPKVQVMKERVLDINPGALVETRECFFLPENSSSFDFSKWSYIVDAVDTVSAKIEIICQEKKSGVPVISSMGAGNKLDPTKFLAADIYQTSVCPLARVMRRECKKRKRFKGRLFNGKAPFAASRLGFWPRSARSGKGRIKKKSARQRGFCSVCGGLDFSKPSCHGLDRL